MKDKKRKILIVAPFFNEKRNVGNYRINRFINWLMPEFEITVISAGEKNEIEEWSWGKNIIIKDNITTISKFLLNAKALKPIFILWNLFLYYFLVPDQYSIWAKNIVNKINNKINLNNYEIVISSSPQNSSHVAAYNISNSFSISFIADFRDGWLDEPLRPILNKWKWRNKLEKHMEQNVVSVANAIFVTSTKWKEMLSSRYNNENKITVLTNNYPPQLINKENENQNNFRKNKIIRLIYTGNFTVFRKQQHLFNPILYFAKNNSIPIIITLIGMFRKKDFIEFNKWEQVLKEYNIKLNIKGYLERNLMFEELSSNDGLLLLSASCGAIPSKLFEFIPLRKPILAITQKESAVWEMSSEIKQMFLVNYQREMEESESAITAFFASCISGKYEYSVPAKYSEEYSKNIFLKQLKRVIG